MVVSLIFFIRGLNQMIFGMCKIFPILRCAEGDADLVQIQQTQREQISAFNFCMGCKDGFHVFKFPAKKPSKPPTVIWGVLGVPEQSQNFNQKIDFFFFFFFFKFELFARIEILILRRVANSQDLKSQVRQHQGILKAQVRHVRTYKNI